MPNPKIIVAQLGARRHYQQPLLFQKWGMLDSFYTDFYAGNNIFLNSLRKHQIYQNLPSLLKKGLDRYEPELEKAKIFHFPLLAYRNARQRKNSSPQEIEGLLIEVAKKFNRKIIKNGLGNVNVVYGFNGASIELFEFAKRNGIRCILDQVIAERSLLHKLLLEEEEYWHDWSVTPFRVDNKSLELMEREQREQELADNIICGSDFVKNSLIARGINSEKISVVAIGRLKDNQSQQNNIKRQTPQQRRNGLRILFAGAVGLRKGIPYLLEALQKIKGKIPFNCKVVGRLEIKSHYIEKYSDICEFTGLVPRSKMTELYSWADVFVLPSICEGSAMVTYEALSWGLPVITTPNSGSIVRDKVDGLVIPIRNSDAIAEKLVKIYENDFQSKRLISSHNYFKQICNKSEETLYNTICHNYIK